MENRKRIVFPTKEELEDFHSKAGVSTSLLDEIRGKFSRLISNPDYYLKRANRTNTYLGKISTLYSWWIENPDMREQLYQETGTSNVREIRATSRKGVERIRFAWEFLRGARLVGGSTIQVLSPSVLSHLAKTLDPDENARGFRDFNQEANIFGTYAENSLQIQSSVEKLISCLRGSKRHPIDQAILADVGLIAIQPYCSANKRLANLTQNAILADEGIVPAVIPPGERKIYVELLEKAVFALSEKNPSKQRDFNDYVAGKINVSLDGILNDLNPFGRGR
jgi:Fic family protein